MFTIKLRRGTAQRWAEVNPVLDDGEPGVEINTKKMKIGDGFHRWNDLSYLTSDASGAIADLLDEHIDSATPHPAYDDGPSFTLLYENAKV